MPSKIVPLLSIFALAAAAAAPARADVVRFSYKGYELETKAGVERLYHRLEARAERFCATPGRRPLDYVKMEAACAKHLTADFVSAIDHPALTRLHTSVTIEEL
ncbi:MAG: UrcA family protein [Parvularculaceae bacterium]